MLHSDSFREEKNIAQQSVLAQQRSVEYLDLQSDAELQREGEAALGDVVTTVLINMRLLVNVAALLRLPPSIQLQPHCRSASVAPLPPLENGDVDARHFVQLLQRHSCHKRATRSAARTICRRCCAIRREDNSTICPRLPKIVHFMIHTV